MGKVVRFVGKIASVVATVASVIPGGQVFAAIAGAVAIGSNLVAGKAKPAQSATQLGRLQAQLNTQAPRKIVLGPRTAMPADIRYYEGSGEDDEFVDYIIVVAAHRIGSIDEIWFEDTLAWKAAGGVQGIYAGYLTDVTVRLEGTAANTIAINGGARWGADDRLTGCAYLRLRIKRTGNSEKAQSPLASGLPGRVTIIGAGMPMYDPRFDSTVGGSGPMRIGDQSSWGPSSGNLIVQALNVLIGWRIAGQLSVGGGLPAKYLDLGSAMTGANICDEPIALSTGGSQPRYRGAGAFSTDDAPMNIVGALLAGCAGDLLDSDGQLSFLIKANTLALPAVTFDDHDTVSGARWDPMGGQTNLPNIIAGSFPDPSPASLYQMVPYPSVKLASEDGIERTAPVDFGVVENAAQSQRLAKQTLQRMQYPGTFTADYNMKGMAAKVGAIVWQTYSPRGWLNKPFRVVSQKPSRSGRIALVLREEHAAIYQWAAEDSAAVQPAEPVAFDPRNTGPILLARKASETANWPQISDTDPARPKPENGATVGAPQGTPVGDREAQDLVDQVDASAASLVFERARIDDAKADIDGLFATYGDTASAAASAQIAEQNADLTVQLRGETAADAGLAANARVIATAQAAAAQQSAILSASLATNALNANPVFADWPAGVPVPAGITVTNFITGTDTFTRGAPGMFGSPNYIIAGSVAGSMKYFQWPSILSMAGGPHVVEVDIDWVSGGLAGTLVFAFYYNSAGEFIGSGPVDLNDPKTLISGASGQGRRYHAAILDLPPATARVDLRAYNNHTDFGDTAKTLYWYRVGIRKATKAEIRDQTVLAPLLATVSTHEGVLAELEGKTVAYLENQVVAGTSRARVSLFARAENGQEASQIDLVADSITLGELSVPTLTIAQGRAQFDGLLTAAAGIRVGATGSWQLAYRPLLRSVADGDLVTFDSVGSIPNVEYSAQGLAPLAAGETYRLTADNPTATSFIARLKIETPAAPTSIVLSNDVASGTGPPRQMDKGSNPDAADNNYNIRVAGTWTGFGFNQGGGGTNPAN